MRKLISYINITPDGYCDHTAVIPDEEHHEFANSIFRLADIGLFGRVTFQLMESYWPVIVSNPTGYKTVDEFAILIDNIEKIVFSQTLKSVEWKNSKLATEGLKEVVTNLKVKSGKNILVGSPNIISQLSELNLIDEYIFLVQPFIAGKGKRFFETLNLENHLKLELIETKVFKSGSVLLHYKKGE